MAYPDYNYYTGDYNRSSYPDSSYQYGSSNNYAVEPESARGSGSSSKRTTVACSRCRQRKIKCSGDPGGGQSCISCRNAGGSANDNCIFTRVSSTPLMHVPSVSTLGGSGTYGQSSSSTYPTSAPPVGGYGSYSDPYGTSSSSMSSRGPVSYQYPQSAYPSVSQSTGYYQSDPYRQSTAPYSTSSMSQDSGIGMASYSSEWYNSADPSPTSTRHGEPSSSKSSRGHNSSSSSKARDTSTILGYVFDNSEPSSHSSSSRRHHKSSSRKPSSSALGSSSSSSQLPPINTSNLYSDSSRYGSSSTSTPMASYGWRSADDCVKSSSGSTSVGGGSSSRHHGSSSSRHGGESSSSRHRSGDGTSGSSSRKHHHSSSSSRHRK